MKFLKFYTGVGARATPTKILKIMTAIAAELSKQGWTLRSGGALGADKAFERGAGRAKEIFYARDSHAKAEAIAARFHPAWDACGFFAKRLHGRNAFQVLGRYLDTPSKFLICWTPDGCIDHAHRSIITGGTGTAISIASAYQVEVFNLKRPEHMARAANLLGYWPLDD